MKSNIIGFCAAVIFSMVLSGCAVFNKRPTSDLKFIYQKSAQYHKPDRNPIIVIPGLLGSKLRNKETGQTVWGAFDGKSLNPNTAEGERILSLPLQDDVLLKDIVDNVEPDGVLESVHINFLGVPLNIRAYANILSTLGAGGYVDEDFGLSGVDYGEDHFTCFQFDYDWRRDNIENAKRLKVFIDAKRSYVQERYLELYGIENATVKFDIVAHSMGGLVARYFARYGDGDLPEYDASGDDPVVPWAGAADIDRVILVGTPSAGSVDAFTQLIDGFDVGPFLPHYESSVIGTFPAIYQLLPRPRHHPVVWKGTDNEEPVDFYDAELWKKYEWGLAATDKRTVKFLKNVLPTKEDESERRKIALSLQRSMLTRAKAFHQAIDVPSEPPEGMEFFLVLGDAEDTPSKVVVDAATGEFEVTEHSVGDGTVLRSSALMDERLGSQWHPILWGPVDWSSVLFLFSDHLGLTTDPAFADNVLYWLLEEPREIRAYLPDGVK